MFARILWPSTGLALFLPSVEKPPVTHSAIISYDCCSFSFPAGTFVRAHTNSSTRLQRKHCEILYQNKILGIYLQIMLHIIRLFTSKTGAQSIVLWYHSLSAKRLNAQTGSRLLKPLMWCKKIATAQELAKLFPSSWERLSSSARW